MDQTSRHPAIRTTAASMRTGGISTAGSDTAFDRIVLLSNPNSTEDAPQLAQKMRDDLTGLLPEVLITMVPTQHAGHGRELAREEALIGRPLLVSVSGDGGYDEVVDGATQSANPDVFCAVLAAGNANDHRRTTQERPLAEAIAHKQPHRIDLLTLTTGQGTQARTRYAHCDIGIGLTPVVALDLEKGSKDHCARCSPSPGSTPSPPNGRTAPGAASTALLANFAQMAKHATLSDTGDPEDGRLEVITIPPAPSGGCSSWHSGRPPAVEMRPAAAGAAHVRTHPSHEG